MLRTPLLSAFGALTIFALAFAGWSEDIRLTYRGYEIEPQVIARNDTIHVAFQEVAGPMRISYLQSTDAGLDWGNIIDLTEPGHLGTMPNLSLSLDRVFIGWGDEDTNPVNWVSNVGYSISIAGESWPPPSYIFHRWTIRGYGKISTTMSSDSIYLAFLPWISDSAGNQLIFFKYSSDLGSTWSDSVVIGRTPEYLNSLGIRKCGGTIYVAWSGLPYPDGQMYEVIVAASQDGGLTWLEPVQLSSGDNWAAQHACVACDESNGNVAIGWMDYGLSHTYPGDLFLRITTDAGTTWGEELHATSTHTVSFPNLSIAGDTLWAVWQDLDPVYGMNNTEIAFTKSTDFGQAWIPKERLTYAEGFSNKPSISYDQGKLHLVWDEHRRPPDSTRDEIYYKRFDPGSDDIEGDDAGNIPNGISLSACPNPFNSNVLINYSNLNKGGEIGIFDIQGKLIRTFKAEGGKSGKINWDATDAMGNKVSSGIYFAKAMNNANSALIKLIYLK